MLGANVFFLLPEKFQMLEAEYLFPFTGKFFKHVTVLLVRESCTF
jgi:hypothetical protein